VNQPKTLPRLTALRWWAALAVYASHVGGNYGVTYAWLVPGGAIGVGFFFVLSGFVLTWSVPDGDTPRRFWRRRFARIYPATFVSNIAALIMVALSVSGPSATPLGTIGALTLTQTWAPGRTSPGFSANGVTWSLGCEAFFYVLFPAVFAWASRRTTRLVACLTGTLLVAELVLTLVLNHAGRPLVPYYWPLLRLPEFLLGIALAIAISRGWRPRLHGPACFAALAFAWWADLTFREFSQLEALVAVPAAAAVIVWAATSDITGAPSRVLTGRWAVRLGEWSFSFYLVHSLVLDAVYGEQHAIDGWQAGVLAFPLAVACTAALHYGVELPMQRRINRRGDKSAATGQSVRVG